MTPVRPKHVPLRRCVVCRRSRPQAELLRLARDDAGHWRLDETRTLGGRGAWLCADDPECQKVKNLRRFFRNEAVSVATQLQARLLTGQGG